MSGSLLRKSGWVAAALIVIAGGIYLLRGPLGPKLSLPLAASVVPQPVGDLPNIPKKQPPASFTLDGCPPEGKGGDPELNILKNRTDPGAYADISFDTLTMLTWPKNVERLLMSEWPVSSRNFISQYEGTPVSVEGYIVALREGTPDSAQCNWTEGSYIDWHLSLTQNARDQRNQSVLAEVTPRIRMNHRWTMDAIHSLLIDQHLPARLSGWLYFDPEHPGDLGVTRSTLWEINPVMQIEVLQNTRWVPLDTLSR
ncbi:MAG TPA: hypothetical protein VF784_07360 [Anaerolineales bacterium]